MSLPVDAANWLVERQVAVDALTKPDISTIWAEHRPEMNKNGVVSTLIKMVGSRGRCMYCGDSRATDVEHHRPKSRFPESAFVWTNLLWACNSCNRKKGRSFPLSSDGSPLLIDPTSVDPWNHLFLVHETGEITPRVDAETGEDDPIGAATVDPAHLPLNVQCVTEARRRAWNSLARGVRAFLDSGAASQAEDDLIATFNECERPDVVVWVLRKEGRVVDPFATLHDRFPQISAQLELLPECREPPA